jgi:hypothetical protein
VSLQIGKPRRIFRALRAVPRRRQSFRVKRAGGRRSMITTQRIADAHRLEIKKKKRRSISEANIIYHQKHIYTHANPLTKVLGLHATRKFFTIKRRNRNYTEAESMPPQHSAPWQRKAWQIQLQKSKEAWNQPSLESRKVAQQKPRLPLKEKLLILWQAQTSSPS